MLLCVSTFYIGLDQVSSV